MIRLMLMLLCLIAVMVLILTLKTGRAARMATTSPRITLEQIQSIAELATLKIPLHQILDTKIHGHTGGVQALIVARGDAWIGCEVSHIDLQFDEDRKEVTVTLDPPKVLSCRLDHDATSVVYIGRRGLWRTLPGEAGESAVIERALRDAQQRMTDIAGEAKHLRRAREQIERLLSDIVTSNGWTLQLRWRMAVG